MSGSGKKRRTRRALLVLPEIPDDLDEATKNGLAIRNAASAAGRCPDCGAEAYVIGPDRFGIHHMVFEHEEDCGATTDPPGRLDAFMKPAEDS